MCENKILHKTALNWILCIGRVENVTIEPWEGGSLNAKFCNFFCKIWHTCHEWNGFISCLSRKWWYHCKQVRVQDKVQIFSYLNYETNHCIQYMVFASNALQWLIYIFLFLASLFLGIVWANETYHIREIYIFCNLTLSYADVSLEHYRGNLEHACLVWIG